MIPSLLQDGRKYQLGPTGPREEQKNTTAHCQVQRLVGSLYSPHTLSSDFMETLSPLGVPEKGGRLEVCGLGVGVVSADASWEQTGQVAALPLPMRQLTCGDS